MILSTIRMMVPSKSVVTHWALAICNLRSTCSRTTHCLMMMRGFGLEITPAFYWSTQYTEFLAALALTVCLILVALGFIWGANWSSYRKISDETGKLSTDFVEIAGLPTTLVNMGLVGLLGLPTS